MTAKFRISFDIDTILPRYVQKDIDSSHMDFHLINGFLPEKKVLEDDRAAGAPSLTHPLVKKTKSMLMFISDIQSGSLMSNSIIP